MSDKEVSKKQKEELQKLADEMASLSSEIVEDYKLNPPHISGSTVIMMHEDNYFLSGSIDETE